MMNSYLIGVLVAVAFVILVLVLKKSSAKKVPLEEKLDEEVSALPLEDAETEPVTEIVEPTVEEGVEEGAEPEREETELPADEIVAETEEAVTEAEIITEPEAVTQPEIVEEAEEEEISEFEAEPVSEIEEPTVEEGVEEGVEPEREETVLPADEIVAETEEAVTEAEIITEPEAVTQPEIVEEAEEEEVSEFEAEPVSEIVEPTVEEGVEEGVELEKEEIVPPADEVVAETEETVSEAEVIPEPEVVPEPEIAEAEEEQVSELEAEPVTEIEEPTVDEGVEESTLAEKEEAVQPLEEVVEEVEVKPVASLSLESYEERLLALKEKQQKALTEAIEKNEESRREQLQIEHVAITESLTFLNQGYAQEMSCRNGALAALELIQPELDTAAYEQAWASIDNGDTEEAEKVFDGIADQDGQLSALAAFQSGCLAECRMNLNRAMERLEKAVNLDDNNPDYLRSAAQLARKLYHHKKALAWFTSLVKLGETKGEDTVELALDRRELAYITALVGQHKEAGALYKQAMVSLMSLLGKEDKEMGICWYQIGKLQEALGRYEKAEDPYKKALAIMNKDGSSAVFGDILDKLAGLYMELEREEEAMPLLERLCAFKEESPNPDKATMAMAYNNFAEASRICGKYEKAEKSFERSLAITEELRGKDHAAVGSILQELTQLCERQGKKDEAKEYQERAAAIFQLVLDAQEAAGQQSENLKL